MWNETARNMSSLREGAATHENEKDRASATEKWNMTTEEA